MTWSDLLASLKPVLPDLQVFAAGEMRWVEVKTKARCAWNRGSGIWVTGFSRRLANEYRAIQQATGATVAVLFSHAKEDQLRLATIGELRANVVSQGVCGEDTVYFSWDRIPFLCWRSAWGTVWRVCSGCADTVPELRRKRSRRPLYGGHP